MRRRKRLPSYRPHEPTGQAVVTLNGKDYYLGRHGTQMSKDAYDRLMAEWLAGGRQLPAARRSMADPAVPEEIELEPTSTTGGPTGGRLRNWAETNVSETEKGLLLHPCIPKSVPAPKIRPGIGRLAR
jgi:hypothetical protein